MNNRELEKLLTDTLLIEPDGLGGYVFRTNNKSNLPFGANYMIQSNPDANGNYQTITYKKNGVAGSVVKIITLTYDANGNVVTYSEQ